MTKERETESEQILSTIKRFKKTNKGETLYVCGVPGKTYVLTEILKKQLPESIFINCAKLTSKMNVYKSIYKRIKCVRAPIQSLEDLLRDHFMSCKKFHCIFLDEFDMLYTKSQSIFYNIFDLPNLRNSSLLLVIAANTMNLSEKIIDPKIRSRIGTNKVYFKPYSHTQLKNLVKVDEKFTEDSIELITRRIGAVSGDCRKMNNILEIAKLEKCAKIDAEKINKIMADYSNPVYIWFLGCLCFEQKIILHLLKDRQFVSLVDLFCKAEKFYKYTERSGFDSFKISDCVLDLIDFGILEKKKQGECLFVKVVLFEHEIKCGLENDKEYRSFISSSTVKQFIM